MNCQISIWIFHIVFIHQLTDIWMVCTFWLSWIILLWTFMYKFLYGHNFNSSWYIPKNGMAGLNGNSLLTFLRNCHFQSSWTILHSYRNVWICSFSTSSPKFVIWLFDHTYSNGYEAWRATVPGVSESDTTWQLNNNKNGYETVSHLFVV